MPLKRRLFSPAAEFAGIVQCRRRRARLCAGRSRDQLTGWGAAHEKIAAGAAREVKLPQNLDFERRAGLTVTATTLYGLRERGELKGG